MSWHWCYIIELFLLDIDSKVFTSELQIYKKITNTANWT